MGRNRSFDGEAVLTGAMHAFRRAGYASLSIRDLEQATGLSSGSLYNAYGNKDGLFRAAFDHYVETIIRARLDAFAGPTATLDMLEQLFLTLWQAPQTDGHGCLMINTMVEGGEARAIVSGSIDAASQLLRTRMEQVLARAIGAEAAVLETDRLLLLYHGILVLSRGGRLATSYAEIVTSEFQRLRMPRGTAH